jgi:hypothetical protein
LRAEYGQRGENISAVGAIRLFKRWDIKFRYLGHLFRIYLDNLENAEGWTEISDDLKAQHWASSTPHYKKRRFATRM